MPLTLSRRIGETLMIGNEVTVTVTGLRGTQVVLSVDAPKDVSVDRKEIRDRKRHAADFDLLKGLHVIECVNFATAQTICCIATTSEREALELLAREFPDHAQDDIAFTTVWDPCMAHYHNTRLERPQDAALYGALLAQARTASSVPFILSMPTSTAHTATQAPTEHRGAA